MNKSQLNELLVLIDTRENLSIDYIKNAFPNWKMATLNDEIIDPNTPLLNQPITGDVAIPELKIMIEIKIATDIEDRDRMKEEFIKMNQKKYHDWEKHALYIGEDILYFKTMNSYAQRANISTHARKTKDKIAPFIKDVINGKYQRGLYGWKHPSKKMTDIGKVLSLINGVSDENADKVAYIMAKKENIEPNELYIDMMEESKLIDALREVFPDKKKGGMKKIVGDAYSWWFGGKLDE